MTKSKPAPEPEPADGEGDIKDAFRAALEAKKNKGKTAAAGGPKAGNTHATHHGPDAARRVRQRRMGSS